MGQNNRSESTRESKDTQAAQTAPELHNAEQDDGNDQAQQIAEEARALTPGVGSPTESEKPKGGGDLMEDSTQDLIDKMRAMESSGRIDMGAYEGEPNFDDEDETYGPGHDPDEDEEPA